MEEGQRFEKNAVYILLKERLKTAPQEFEEI